MELEQNSDPDDDDNDDDESVEGGGAEKSFVAGKKPGYGMKTKPAVAMLQENASNLELRTELKMAGGLPDLGNM